MRDLPSNTKLIKIDKLERHEVEKNLTLLGLIVFENRIKRETKPVIEKLHRAKVRTIMVTGDHIQTALSVARESKMVDSSASNVIVVKAKIDEDTLEPSYFFHSLDDIQPIEIQVPTYSSLLNKQYEFKPNRVEVFWKLGYSEQDVLTGY